MIQSHKNFSMSTEWPKEFLLYPAIDVPDNEVMNSSRCTLCGVDHVYEECPNMQNVCRYCGWVGYHRQDCPRPPEIIPATCCYCGRKHLNQVGCFIRQGEVPEEPTIQQRRGDYLYQETEGEMCRLCGSLPVVINGLCNYCNKLVERRKLGATTVCRVCDLSPAVKEGLYIDCIPPKFDKFYEVGGTSNWPVSLDVSDQPTSGSYNFFWTDAWEALVPAESVGSCDETTGATVND